MRSAVCALALALLCGCELTPASPPARSGCRAPVIQLDESASGRSYQWVICQPVAVTLAPSGPGCSWSVPSANDGAVVTVADGGSDAAGRRRATLTAVAKGRADVTSASSCPGGPGPTWIIHAVVGGEQVDPPDG